MNADALAQQQTATEEFGLYRCDLPEHAQEWVRFKLTGYPFKLRRELDGAENDQAVMLLILQRVIDWSVHDAEGNAMPAPAECIARPELLDNLEDPMLYWIVRSFYSHRAMLNSPRKN